MIALGIQLGGPEQSGVPIDVALLTAMRIAKKAREPNYNSGADTWINPIYILPGSIVNPTFEGYKLGHFSRKEKGLVVMIAVPQSVVDGEGIPEFISKSLREAVGMAAAHFKKKSISFSTLKTEKIIRAIEAGLEAR
jgi:hypothetical protein